MHFKSPPEVVKNLLKLLTSLLFFFSEFLGNIVKGGYKSLKIFSDRILGGGYIRYTTSGRGIWIIQPSRRDIFRYPPPRRDSASHGLRPRGPAESLLVVGYLIYPFSSVYIIHIPLLDVVYLIHIPTRRLYNPNTRQNVVYLIYIMARIRP